MNIWPWLRARFSFHGRASRKEYSLQCLGAMLITFGSILATVAVFVLAVTLGTHAQHRFAGFEAMYWPIVPLWASIIGFAFYIWALLAATARRGHDLDQKFRIGRLDIFGLRYLYRRGTTGPNQYGPDPLQKATLPE